MVSLKYSRLRSVPRLDSSVPIMSLSVSPSDRNPALWHGCDVPAQADPQMSGTEDIPNTLVGAVLDGWRKQKRYSK